MNDFLSIAFRGTCVSLVTVACAMLSGCHFTPKTKAGSERFVVAVSIVPQAEFVRRIAGELVDTVVMIPTGASPATYEPKPQQIQALTDCAIYFTIGVPFEEAWLARLHSANPAMKMVDTAAGVQHLPMASHAHHPAEDADGIAHTELSHEIDQAGDHPDPHIWLAPRLVKIQAANIARALCELCPDQSDRFEDGLKSFLAELDRLDQQIRARLNSVTQRKFMVFHPAWGYFAREFGLEMIPVEIGGQEPSGAELAAFVDVARAEGLKIILAQPEFNTRAAETLAREIGGRVLLVSPLGLPWAENLLKVAEAFARELQTTAGSTLSGESRQEE